MSIANISFTIFIVIKIKYDVEKGKSHDCFNRLFRTGGNHSEENKTI